MDKTFKRELTKDVVFWYTLVSALVIMTLAIVNFDHPEFGFSGEGYGLGVVTLVLFPIIWMLIYVFCKYIALKNERIAELEEKVNAKEETGSADA